MAIEHESTRLARAAHPGAPWLSMRARTRLIHGVALLLASLGAVIILIPPAWMFSSSLKDNIEIFTFPPSFIPAHPRWSNYPEAVMAIPFFRYVLNSLLIAALSVTGTVLSSALVAYAFARLRAPGLDLLFYVVLATIMLPGTVTLIPRFLIFNWLGWVGTYLPLIVPSWTAGAFNVFLLRQFFRNIPRELDDAARVDGASFFGIFWRIIVPQSIPALSAVAIFDFVSQWNNFLDPLIYIQDTERYTIQVGLSSFRDIYNTQWNYLMADSLLATLPCLVLFFLFQRVFIQGVVVSGIKG
jgi:ABC-type glycerol-3-phosphate transport system permease component